MANPELGGFDDSPVPWLGMVVSGPFLAYMDFTNPSQAKAGLCAMLVRRISGIEGDLEMRGGPGDIAWVERQLGRPLAQIEKHLVSIVCAMGGCGPYDIDRSSKHQRAWYERLESWPNVSSVTVAIGAVSTYDRCGLTDAVLLAHEIPVRLEISPYSRIRVLVVVSSREREGSMSQRHPTIEGALSRFSNDQARLYK